MFVYYIGINGICGLNLWGNGLFEVVIDRYGDVVLSYVGLLYSIVIFVYLECVKSG